jgi:pyridoxine 4-dehydrogenase
LAETEVARIGLGTNRPTRTAEHVAFVREAVVAGVNVIDTAHTYAGGDSEETIGAALSPIPDDCIVATKGGWNGARPETLRAEVEESLHRLRTDSIALYYLHRVDPQTPLEESLGAIKEYRDSGKIRESRCLQRRNRADRVARQVVPISAVQNRFNLSERTYDDVVDYCAREGLVFLPYFPLHGDGRSALAEIADRHGATPAQIALARLLRRSPTMLPIPGTRSVEHVRENVAALDIELSDAEFQALR